MPDSDGPLFDPRRSPLRERQRSEVEREGDALLDALFEDLASTNLQDAEICDRSSTDRAHFSRVKARQAHPPQPLVAFAIDQSRHRPPRYLAVACAIAEHEPKPKPPPDAAEVFHVYREILAEKRFGDSTLDELVRQEVERRLRVTLPSTRSGPGGAA